MRKILRSTALSCALLAVHAIVAAQPVPSRADAAYDRAQKMRAAAREKVQNAHGSREALEAAAQELHDALDFLDTRDVHDLAEGNVYLHFRRADVLREYAYVLASLGHDDAALDALERMLQVGWSPGIARWLLDEESLASLRDKPRFKAIIATLGASERLWKAPAFDTGFRDTLPVEQRIAGLTLFWSEARSGFAYFDHVPALDWDRVYLDFLTRVMAAQTTAEYYAVLMQLAPLLHDGHTNVYPPRELQARFYARPPLQTEKLGDRVVVTAVTSASLRTRVRAGDEIVAIDGVPVEQYARERVDPFVSASTPQDRDVRDFGYQLLAGDAKQPLRLALRGADGVQRTETVAREGYDDVTHAPAFEFRMLPGHIAYLSLDHFESDAPVKAFEQALPRILEAKGLVLDVRRNGGGSTGFGLQILSYLTDQPVPVARSLARGETSIDRTRGPQVIWRALNAPGASFSRKHERVFDGPVAVLVGPRTFSAAEDFVMSFDAMKRGTLVGSPTAGSTGQPLVFSLPGGGTARICVKRDTYPDGREFVGRGIAPQVPVQATIDDIRAARDPVLERAVAELTNAR